MIECLGRCLQNQPWWLWLGAAVVFALIGAGAAATGGLEIVIVGVSLGVIGSVVVAALAVFGITVSMPVVYCLSNCLLFGSRKSVR